MAPDRSSGALLIGTLLRTNAAAVPDRVAASLGDETLTHLELDRAGDRWAWRLHAAGVRRGDRVVGWTDGGLDVLCLFAGLSKLGAMFAPLSPAFSVREAIDVAGVAQPKFLVADRSMGEAASEVAQALGASVLTREEPDERETLPDTSYEDAEIDERDPHILFFTSGSTGRPKGVVLSHRTNHLRTFQGVFRDRPEISVCMFPLFHMAPFTLALSAWQTRGEIVIVPKPTAEALLEAVERRHANRLYCIPAVWRRILESDTDRYDLSTLTEVDTGTSATPVELVRSLKQRFPSASLRIYYGATETGTATALADADVLDREGSVGLPPPGGEIRIADDGEVCVRKSLSARRVFRRSRSNRGGVAGRLLPHRGSRCPRRRRLSLDHRSQEGSDPDGRGESVSPNEVEEVLAEHPDLAEVAVVGVPDADWGEIVCAVVVAVSGRVPSLADLQKHCEGRLAGYKRPRRLELRKMLPKTAATGQVQRALLVQEMMSAPTSNDEGTNDG